jgi:multicomponent Na+:H+ antiporter subunit E
MSRYRTHIFLFLALLGFWFVLSPTWDPIFAGIGLVSAAGVTFLAADLVRRAITDPLATGDPAKTPRPIYTLGDLFRRIWWFAVYLVWLLGRVVVANIQVARVVLHPRLPIEPAFLHFRTTLRSHVARTTLAASITLTPSTITVELEDDTYVIHTLFPSGVDGIIQGDIQRRIARFAREHDEALDIRWEPVTPEDGP